MIVMLGQRFGPARLSSFSLGVQVDTRFVIGCRLRVESLPVYGGHPVSQEDIDRAPEVLQGQNESVKRLAAEVADERIAVWEKRKLSVALAILAVLGFASYAAIRDRVASYFVESVKPGIADEVKRKTAFVSTQDPAISDLRAQIADLSKSVADLSKTLADATKTTPVPPPHIVSAAAPSSDGYAFFGVRDASGQWTQRYFDIDGGGDRPPKAGDSLRASGSVNIRQGYIVYGDAGWVNKPSTGILRRGDVIRVNEVREVVDGFWWVSFTPGR